MILLALHSLSLPFGFGAEDPARFFAVNGWQVTFTKELSISGSGPYGPGIVDYSMAHHLNTTTLLCPFIVIPVYGIWQSDGQKIPNAGTITERQSAGAGVFYAADGGAATGPFALTINLAANEYSIQFPGLLATVTYNAPEGTIVEEGSASWGPTITRPLPTNGMVLSGSAIIPLSESGPGVLVNPVFLNPGAAAQLLTNNSVTVGWNLKPAQSLEVVVSLKPSYENWIPEASLTNKANEFEGNNIKITAELLIACAGGPVVAPDKFRFELVNVSHEPGVCLNYPPAGPADTKPDLRFNPRLNPTNKFSILNEGTVLETLPGNTATKITASLSAYDFGAYATLKVTAMIGGVTNVGYLKAEPAKPTNILLPKRRPTSQVADAWKDQHQVRNIADDDDSDNTPVGDMHKGDGFSLYEEYRGFAENRKHLRTNPDVKDLFVRDQIGGAEAKAQILKFESTSGLDVHHKLRPGEIAVDAIMNFNHGYANLHDQHGLYVRGRREMRGFSEAVTRTGFDTNGVSTPGTTSRIELEPVEIGLDLRDLDNIQTFRDYAPDSLAHELAHGCSVYHHGDLDEPTLLLKRFTPEGGRFLVATDGNEANVRFEDGVTSTILRYTAVGPNQVLALATGARRGQHSGNMDCIMRYHVADHFPSQPDPMHLFYQFKPDDQHTRTLFCESAAGTKANAPTGGLPSWPRFGNAADKRGDCQHQLCVNDYYFDDELHKR